MELCCLVSSQRGIMEYPNGHITQWWRKDNVFTTSTRRRRRRVDVVKTLLLRRVPAGMYKHSHKIYSWNYEITLHIYDRPWFFSMNIITVDSPLCHYIPCKFLPCEICGKLRYTALTLTVDINLIQLVWKDVGSSLIFRKWSTVNSDNLNKWQPFSFYHVTSFRVRMRWYSLTSKVYSVCKHDTGALYCFTTDRNG